MADIQKEIQQVIAKQEEARAALAALPEDAPAAIRDTMAQAVKDAEADVLAVDQRIQYQKQESARQETVKGEKGLIAIIAALVIVVVGYLLLSGEGKSNTASISRQSAKAVKSDCLQWYDPQWGETIEICGNVGIIHSQDGIPDALERWVHLDGPLQGKAYVMPDRIGSPNLAYVIQSDGTLAFWTNCERGDCRRVSVFSQS